MDPFENTVKCYASTPCENARVNLRARTHVPISGLLWTPSTGSRGPRTTTAVLLALPHPQPTFPGFPLLNALKTSAWSIVFTAVSPAPRTALRGIQ